MVGMKILVKKVFLEVWGRIHNKKYGVLFVSILISMGLNAQVVFENSITGANPNTSNPYIIGQSFNSNVSVSGIGRGSGVTGSNANNRYSANNWTQGASSSSNDYFYWTVGPTGCNEIDFSSLEIAFERSSSGPQNFALRSSIDNYASDIWSYNYTSTVVQSQTISLASGSFQNLTTNVTFRIYGWAATSGSGTFSINSFVFNGAVNALPSPVAGSISGSSSVCSGSNSSLTLSGYTGSIQWQSSNNNTAFSNINGATSANYSTPNLTTATYYRAAVTLGNCPAVFSPSFTVGITPSSITPTGASACGPSSVVLSANSICPPANSTIQWYAAQTGGQPIATGNTYTTPVLNTTTTYFVSSNVIAGNTIFANDESDDSGLGLLFNVTSEMLLNSVQVVSEGSGFVTVQLFGPGGIALTNFPAIVFPIANGLNTLNLGWLIPVGNGYSLVATNLSNDVHLTTTENFSGPYGLDGFGSIVGEVGSGSEYNYFYNWNISSPRTAVTATIAPVTSSTTTASACDSYTWSVNGTTYTASGTYTSVTGCNTKTLVLTITPSSNITSTISACDSYTWSVNGTTYTASGTYTSVTGCNTKTLVLTITPSTNNTTTASACDSYTWTVNGTTYNTSGTYTSVTGCHTKTLVLTITPSTNVTSMVSACDSYTWSVNGTTYTSSGTYTSVTGCNTKTLVLTITPSTNNTTTASACDSYTWSVNGSTYTTSGTYTSVTGCNTKTLVLTITPSTNVTSMVSACDSYTWSVNGTTYTASGTYTSVTGCHTETLVLTITPSTNNTTTASACDSYTWSVNGTTYTTSGSYTSVTGCHTETLVLTITPSTNNTTTASACDIYSWSVNGTTYTSSGAYTSITGCHTETLVLTITPSTNNTTTASACDTYTWTVNGTTYTTSGTYTSVTGCHTETLVLTVNASSIYYVDADGDGFGSTATANFCSMPATGYSLNNTDCNDAVATIYPGAPELCNTVDDNCNGVIDEGCPSTIPGEEPFNALLAPSTYYSYCNSFYGTLAGAFPSDYAQTSCETGEDVWYSFTAITSGITIFIGSNANDIVIELQDVNGNLIEVENAVNGPGTEVLSTNSLIPGSDYRFGIRNKNSNLNPGGQYSACVRHLRRGGSDSGTSATWPSTLSTCALFKAIYCGGTGVQYRYTWTGISGSANGQVFTRTQTSDYLNVTAVIPSLHAGGDYNVLVTAIYSIPNGTGAIEVFELTAYTPAPITILPVSNVALRSTDQMSNGPRYRGSVVAAMPWVCGVTNWRWRFTEVNPLTLQTVGLPIEQNRGAASNYINLNNVAALQFGKTYAVQSAPLFSYTGTNYQWGPVTYMAIIGSAGLIIDASQDVAQDAMQDSPKDVAQDAPQGIELSVYPNPSNGSDLNLNISGIESDNVIVRVYDSMGRKIQSERFIVNGTLQTELNFKDDLSNGMYLIEVTSGTLTKSVRILIEG
jgi:hypothetical protein